MTEERLEVLAKAAYTEYRKQPRNMFGWKDLDLAQREAWVRGVKAAIGALEERDGESEG